MNSQKWSVRFFTVADYEEEEIWLRERHKNGWKLVKTFPHAHHYPNSLPYLPR